MTIPKLKIDRAKLLNASFLLIILPYFTLTISLASSGYVAWFIYQNVIKGVEEIKSLEFLKQDVVETSINLSLFEKVVSSLDDKLLNIEKFNFNELNNPFSKKDTDLDNLPTVDKMTPPNVILTP